MDLGTAWHRHKYQVPLLPFARPVVQNATHAAQADAANGGQKFAEQLPLQIVNRFRVFFNAEKPFFTLEFLGVCDTQHKVATLGISKCTDRFQRFVDHLAADALELQVARFRQAQNLSHECQTVCWAEINDSHGCIFSVY
jgi:hypothetical protein